MNASLLEICLKDLFAEYEALSQRYPTDTVKSILRVRDMYLWLLKYPFSRDSEFVKEECGRYKVSRPTAYSDLNLIKALVPDLSKTAKDYCKWKFTEMILQTFELAKKKGDVRTMERAVATYGKYTGLDKEQEEKIDLSKIIPPPLIPTEDPSVLGFKKIPNLSEYVKKLEDKYLKDIPEMADISEEAIEVEAIEVEAINSGFIDLDQNNDNLQSED